MGWGQGIKKVTLIGAIKSKTEYVAFLKKTFPAQDQQGENTDLRKELCFEKFLKSLEEGKHIPERIRTLAWDFLQVNAQRSSNIEYILWYFFNMYLLSTYILLQIPAKQ